jgi:hypothetical protein
LQAGTRVVVEGAPTRDGAVVHPTPLATGEAH